MTNWHNNSWPKIQILDKINLRISYIPLIIFNNLQHICVCLFLSVYMILLQVVLVLYIICTHHCFYKDTAEACQRNDNDKWQIFASVRILTQSMLIDSHRWHRFFLQTKEYLRPNQLKRQVQVSYLVYLVILET